MFAGVKLHHIGIILWILNVLQIKQVYSIKDGGGYCLSEAQYGCFDLSTKLIVAQRNNDRSSVCRSYEEYDKCIKSKVTEMRCSFTKQERDLYAQDFVIWYQKPPFSCVAAPSGLVSAVYQGQNVANVNQISRISLMTTILTFILLSTSFCA